MTTQASKPASPDQQEVRATARATAASRHTVHRATHKVVHDDHLHVHIAVPGGEFALELPPPDRLAFYAGLAAVAAFGVVSWSTAAVAGVAHALATDHNNQTLVALGEAMEEVI